MLLPCIRSSKYSLLSVMPGHPCTWPPLFYKSSSTHTLHDNLTNRKTQKKRCCDSECSWVALLLWSPSGSLLIFVQLALGCLLPSLVCELNSWYTKLIVCMSKYMIFTSIISLLCIYLNSGFNCWISPGGV